MKLLRPLPNYFPKAQVALLILVLLLPLLTTAQSYDIKYYNRLGKEVAKDQAYYMVIGGIPNGKDYFVGKTVEKFVSNQKIKAKKTYGDDGTQIGVGVEYHENGQVREKYQLKNGHVFGGYVSWYPNGQKELEREYTAYSTATAINYLTYNFWDSLGNQLVTDGRGDLIEYYTDYSVAARGKVNNRMRIGTWKGYYPNGNRFYIEKYKSGELLSGTSTLPDSTKFEYKQINTLPSPKMGFVKYYQKLTREMRYPKSAKKLGLQGSVLIAYTINEKGQVADHHVIKSLSPDCDQEALRLFREVPVEWNAGNSRGVPKSFVLTLPVSFKL